MLWTFSGRREKGSSFTDRTVDDHNPLWLQIATPAHAKANATATSSQRQVGWTYPRTKICDLASLVFEPEPEPYGTLPGIEEVLSNSVYTIIEADSQTEGRQDGGIRGIREEQCQQEDSLWTSEDAPIENGVTTVDDTNCEPTHVDDFPQDGHIENELEQHDRDGNFLTATDNKGEALDKAARNNEKELDIDDDAAPKRLTEPVEVVPQKREIIVDYGNNLIWGRYPLFDLLSLSTTSGDISVTVVPQPADPMYPDEPARLRIRSQSGSVSVSFTSPETEMRMGIIERAEYGNGVRYENPHTLPLRPYEIEIETESGTISGSFIVSTAVYLSTKSGTINATLIPIASDLEQKVSLRTQTTSGSQQIHLTDPVYIHGHPRGLPASITARAAHLSHGGGSLQIRYPPDWAGRVRAQPGSGSVSLVGQGMKVVRGQDGSVEGCISADGKGGDWWGAQGDMDVSLESKGAAMFVAG